MHTRHTNELLSRLERVEDVGVAEIRKNELRTWFNQDRLSAGVWRDIQDKWHEVLTAEGYEESQLATIPLLVGESDGVFVFVYGANLQLVNTDPKTEGWLLPITDWMKPKERKIASQKDKAVDPV